MADLAYFIESKNSEYHFDAAKVKWIAFGGSYPGSLAAWLREKYPQLVHGSVSTSGPLLAKADFFGMCSIFRYMKLFHFMPFQFVICIEFAFFPFLTSIYARIL